GLVLMALGFSVSNFEWLMTVPLSMAFVLFAVPGYLSVTGKPLDPKMQSILQAVLLVSLIPAMFAAIQLIGSGQRIEFFSLEFGLLFILLPGLLIDLRQLYVVQRSQRKKTP
ncbi:MAG: hypothetical protein JNN05_08640, partial [Candidatus Omnitrophica bacterium]|nr:hypothetical protein [Candidatus Omnitrophota bacterium]